MPKIKENTIFATPKKWSDIEKWIERHNPEERVHLYTVAMMAWNLAAAVTNIEENEDVAAG
ncbi:MAG: hypothetical protein JRJ00_00810 [Deltaproteobacteria bacterium]|nr:hypothetical protein [Deltaproteobacteria bacterium]